jgi:hypothetical protein
LKNILLNDQWVIEETRRNLKVLESNENENTIYQKVWDIAKAVLRGKCIAMSAYIKNTERSLMWHLKLLEKQEQAKTKTSRKKEIIRAKINEIETPTKIQRNIKRKSWFFEKINKIEKPMVNLAKMRKEMTQISKIRNEKGEIATNIKETQGISRDYFKNLFSNKLENLEETD